MEIKFNNVDYNDKNKKMILSNINICFKENTITGICGKSGSGKTSLLELINTTIVPTKGNIKIGSKEINSSTKIFSNFNKIGYVPKNIDDYFLFDVVKKEIGYGVKKLNKKVIDVEKHVKDALLMVGLDESYLEKNIYNLSSSEKQKIAIASVLAINPKIILFDEPTSKLDNQSKDDFIKIVKMLKNKYNKVLIIVSNDTDMLLKLCDDIVILNEGEVVLEGNRYDVFKKDIGKYGLKRPKIIEFQQLVLKEKGIKMLSRDDINDLMKDVYRHVK